MIDLVRHNIDIVMFNGRQGIQTKESRNQENQALFVNTIFNTVVNCLCLKKKRKN